MTTGREDIEQRIRLARLGGRGIVSSYQFREVESTYHFFSMIRTEFGQRERSSSSGNVLLPGSASLR